MIRIISDFNKNNRLSISLMLSVIIPMALGFLLSIYIPDWRWSHYPFHAMVESVGSLSSLIIATLMILMINNNHLPRYYIWIAAALISMGILDGFHAVLHEGVSFVWLHSIATMIGGLTFMAIWLPESVLSASRQKLLLTTVIVSSLFIGVISILFQAQLPIMVIAGEFSILAKVLNISGGIGFLIGSSYFIYHHLKNKNTHFSEEHKNEDIVFANHALLFGIAGILFESSVIWDAGWWWWHILRLLAYLVVLIYFLTLFKEQQDILSCNEKKLSDANKNLEYHVYQRTKELEKANEAKSEFLSSMSHELRTPMNAILGFSQLLNLDEEIQGKQKDSINEILHAGQHLLSLINGILDLSKIEEGKLDIDIEDMDVSEAVLSSLSIINPIAENNNIQITNTIPVSSKHIIRADALRFKQVIINLLSNAIKYNNKNGEVIISVSIVDNEKIRICIKDTGPGISKEKQEKLFTPFERLGYEGSVVEGAGIGLVLSQRLMKLMDGDIHFTSTPGQGSTFYIEFPFNN